jgi:hypothetical protein
LCCACRGLTGRIGRRDYGTVNVTRWIENGSPWTAPLGMTIEAAEIAKAFGTWEQPLEPILHAPWGTQLRPCAPSFHDPLIPLDPPIALNHTVAGSPHMLRC